MTRVRRLAALVALAACVVLPGRPVAAEEAERFLLTGHFQFRIGESVQDQARVYKSESGAPRVLVVADELGSPVLLTAGERTIQRVDPDSLSFPEERPHEALLSEGGLGRPGPAKISGQNLYFYLPDGQRGIVEPKDPILGEMSVERIFDELPEFARNAEDYEANVGQLRLLESASDAEIHVFFGTWCRHCESIVPRLIRVQQQLDGEGPAITYHAVPQRIREHALARRLRVRSVPTALVLRGPLSPQSVVARLAGGQLEKPELALTSALFGGD